MEQLESSLALHLEQTSRLLAATSGSNKAAIAAQSIKLKKSVAPQAEFRFNEALDKLSQEIVRALSISLSATEFTADPPLAACPAHP